MPDPSISATATDEESLGAQQSNEYASAISTHLPAQMIDEAYALARNAFPRPIYALHPEIICVYEILERDGWEDTIRRIAEIWTSDENNVKRAEQCVGRKAERQKLDLLRAFGMFRLKERFDCVDWISVPDGLGKDLQKLQTAVFIALTDLTPNNGFFMYLKKGEDVCIDSKTTVKFPPSGGGLGVILVLSL